MSNALLVLINQQDWDQSQTATAKWGIMKLVRHTAKVMQTNFTYSTFFK